ncbi:MAG: hypothetical protein KJ749_11345 [Planctomycetes bacterium]|nr:hypothetical protein [Planctomycetota bacterium]
MYAFRCKTKAQRMGVRSVAVLGLALICGCPTGPTLPTFNGVIGDGKTTVVSWDQWGTLPDGGADLPSISADGRYVAFQLYNVDIVSEEIYVHNRQTGQTTLASIASDGTRGDRGGYNGVLSADARYLAFASDSTNLAANDRNLLSDVFVRDLQAGLTERVSISSSGTEGSKSSYNPAISADGRFVAFASDSSDLVSDDTNNEADIFVRDRQTGQTRRVSVDSSGVQGDAPGSYHSWRGACTISGNGLFVAFVSDAPNLVPDDTNSAFDLFVHDVTARQTIRASVDSTGAQADADSHLVAISADGRLVAFASRASNLVGPLDGADSGAFVHDRDADGNGVFDETCPGCRATTRVDVNMEAAPGPTMIVGIALSDNGRFVAFERGFSAPLPPPDEPHTYGDSDVFVHDRQEGQTRRVSVDVPGVRATSSWTLDFGLLTYGIVNETRFPSLSHDGGLVAFRGYLGYSYAGVIEHIFVERLGD